MVRHRGIHCGEVDNLLEAGRQDMIPKSRLAVAPIQYRERMSCKDEGRYSVSLSMWIRQRWHGESHRELEPVVELLPDVDDGVGME